MIAAVTIHLQFIALRSRRSSLSLVDVSQRKAINIFLKFWWDFEQFYQKEIVKIWKQPNSKSIAVLIKIYLLFVVKLSIFLVKGHEKEPPANLIKLIFLIYFW